MLESNDITVRKTRQRFHVIVIALLPVVAQIAVLFWVGNWAEGSESGEGMLGMLAFIVFMVALPITMIINVVIATFTPMIHFFWMLLLAVAIAVVLPVVAGLSILPPT